MKPIIGVERLLSLDDVIDRINAMNEFGDSTDLVFDFSGLQYVKTIPAALFARELRILIKNRSNRGLRTYSTGHTDDKSLALAYLAFIGFFDFIGLPNVGALVRGSAEVSGRYPYLAITKYNYQRFKVAAEYDPYRTEYDYIQEESLKIAELLKATDIRGSLFGYAIREILRNAYEHSGAADFYAMGQSWPDGGLELVIMDDGNGMLSTLKAKYPNLKSEKDAIRYAMMPGVSGADFSGKNKYNNSGFGLYVLSEFAKRYGSITVVSGSDLVMQSTGGEKIAKVSDDGTLVGIYLKAIPSNAKEIVEGIIKEGEKISIVSEYPVRPSKQTWNL